MRDDDGAQSALHLNDRQKDHGSLQQVLNSCVHITHMQNVKYNTISLLNMTIMINRHVGCDTCSLRYYCNTGKNTITAVQVRIKCKFQACKVSACNSQPSTEFRHQLNQTKLTVLYFSASKQVIFSTPLLHSKSAEITETRVQKKKQNLIKIKRQHAWKTL